jgi:penicillin amidase
MRRIQADIVSRPALELVAKLALPAEPDRQTQRAMAMLRGWDGAMRADRPEPLIYHAWLGVLVERLLVAKTGIRDRYFHANAELVLQVLSQRPDWCGPAKDASTNPCVALLWDALSEALATVRRDLGDPEKARWGDVHEARFDHPILAKLPGLAAWSGLRIAVPGDNYTVNRAATFGEKPGEPYATRHGSGYRGIYPLSNLSLSVNSIAPGQSGNPFSKHYGDALADWSRALLQRHAAAGAERDRWPVLKLTPLATPPRASID